MVADEEGQDQDRQESNTDHTRGAVEEDPRTHKLEEEENGETTSREIVTATEETDVTTTEVEAAHAKENIEKTTANTGGNEDRHRIEEIAIANAREAGAEVEAHKSNYQQFNATDAEEATQEDTQIAHIGITPISTRMLTYRLEIHSGESNGNNYSIRTSY
jgi:hypothetical protein